jgi:ribonuclease P protein component
MIVVSTASSVQPSGPPRAARSTLRKKDDVLRRSSEFSTVQRLGTRRPGRTMHVTVHRREQGIRVGFVAGRGIGGAVQRNRARRRLREAWRALAGRMSDGFDVVVAARQEIRGAKMHDLVAEMEALLKAGGVVEP